MTSMEAQNKQEQITATTEINNKGKEVSEKNGNRLGDKIKEKRENLKEKRSSTKILKDFPEKQKTLITNTAVNEALKDPNNTEKIKTMQGELGYNNKEGKNYYNPTHEKDMKEPDGKMKAPDGTAGPFTIGAINNMIADKEEGGKLQEMKSPKEKLSQLDGVKDYIGTLHPYFYHKLDKSTQFPDGPKKEKLTTVVNVMSQIKEGTAKKEDIQNMQVALHKTDCYPTTHNKEQKDGVPGPFTQVALQNFTFNYVEGQAENPHAESDKVKGWLDSAQKGDKDAEKNVDNYVIGRGFPKPPSFTKSS